MRRYVGWFATAGAVLATLVPIGTPAGATSVSQCRSDDVAVTFHARDAGMGHRYGVLRLTNVSDRACRIGGYGGVSYVGHGDGTQIGAAATRDPGDARSFVLAPSERARSLVDEVVAQNYPRQRCHPRAVDGFRVFVPDETRSQYVVHPTTGCANRRIHLISHGPFLPS